MGNSLIFGIQFWLSLIVYGLLARWYVSPRLAVLPLHEALVPLLFPHALRHVGMVFLIPAVVAPTLPRSARVQPIHQMTRQLAGRPNEGVHIDPGHRGGQTGLPGR
jgi:hypothetical protein